jgi:surfactin synthase thioesterase subunit/acyl carrier protein
MPIGVVGEIHIGGETLARGYLHRPDLDAEAFVADPFRPGGRLYRTGDRGWVDAQGNFHFVGRLDGQVKIRGYRVELGEVEAALLAVEGVTQAIVQQRDLDGRAVLQAWVATRSGMGPDALQRVLRLRLPDYMVPSSITAMRSLPLGSSGKVDVDALPAPALSASRAVVDRPLRQIEQDLLSLWQDVLGRTALTVEDNFFEVGGDSLAAVSILTGAERLLGRRIPLYMLTEHPTIASLVDALDDAPDPHSVVIRLSAARNATPLYLAASGNGDRMRFQALAHALDDGCCLHMMQPPMEGIPSKIRGLAALYAERILAQAPQACFVGGFSVGGIAALETARILRERGVDVRGLILIETVYPKMVWGGTLYWRVFRWLVSHLRIQDMSLNGRRLGAMVADVGLNAQVMAMGGYRPAPVDTPLALIKTRGLSRWHGMLFRSWRRLAGTQLSEHLVPGMHGSVFEAANVGALATTVGHLVRGGWPRVSAGHAVQPIGADVP